MQQKFSASILALSAFCLVCVCSLPTFVQLDFDAGGSYVATGPGYSGHYLPNGTVQVNPQFNGTLVLDTGGERMFLDSSFFGKRWAFADRAYIIVPVLGSSCFVIESNYSDVMLEYRRAVQHDDIFSLGQLAFEREYQVLAQSAFECHLPTSVVVEQDNFLFHGKNRRIAFHQRILSPFSGNVGAFVDTAFNNFRSLTEDDESYFDLPASCDTPVSYATFCANYYPPNLFS